MRLAAFRGFFVVKNQPACICMQVAESAQSPATSGSGREQPSKGVRAGALTVLQLEKTVQGIVEQLVGASVAIEAPLAAQGLDSLASMELRQKLQVLYVPG